DGHVRGVPGELGVQLHRGHRLAVHGGRVGTLQLRDLRDPAAPDVPLHLAVPPRDGRPLARRGAAGGERAAQALGGPVRLPLPRRSGFFDQQPQRAPQRWGGRSPAAGVGDGVRCGRRSGPVHDVKTLFCLCCLFFWVRFLKPSRIGSRWLGCYL
ncbi:unnamed protein product, partial [Ectocarpus sp. 6 AP-2014]